ncbi:hypothetical protein Tco_0351950 [Tanacetum coccineum]
MGINALCIQSDALNQLCAYSVCALRTRPVSALRTQPVCALRTQPVSALRTQPVYALRTQPVWPRTSQIARPEMDPKKVQKHHYQAEMVVVVMVVDYVKVEMYAVSSWENSHTEIYNDLFVCNKHTHQ